MRQLIALGIRGFHIVRIYLIIVQNAQTVGSLAKVPPGRRAGPNPLLAILTTTVGPVNDDDAEHGARDADVHVPVGCVVSARRVGAAVGIEIAVRITVNGSSGSAPCRSGSALAGLR